MLLSAIALCLVHLSPSPDWIVHLPEDRTRTWIGPDWFTCRLQDWRLHEGRIECLTKSPRRPNRMAHFLPLEVAPEEGTQDDFHVVLEVGTFGGAWQPGSWAGLLIGCGGPDVDWRTSALVQNRPAEDGGLLVVIDAGGRIEFRDFERGGSRDIWGLNGPLPEGMCTPLETLERDGPGFDPERPPGPLILTLLARRGESGWRLEARCEELGKRILSSAVVEVPERHVAGSIGLVSHGGCEGPDERGFWFRRLMLPGAGPESPVRYRRRSFGPVWSAPYTISRGTVKMTVQMAPLSVQDGRSVALETREEDGEWRLAASASIQPGSNTAHLRIEGYEATRNVPYRLRYQLDGREHFFEGTLRAEPEQEVVVAAFTGNKHYTGGLAWNGTGLWFPHTELVRAVDHHDPDLLYFSGDQIYEGDLTGAQRKPLDDAFLDYHDKWQRWCWAFQDLVRHRPTICIPDDHDVYHGNIWGAGGRHARTQDEGGYTMPADFVRMVERTQTSHLPDPFDPTPIEQGIGVYYTDLVWGGVSFAILEDRKFKSSPRMVTGGDVKNGWFQNEDFDAARDADVPGAVLLGQRQLDFLRSWAGDWSGDAWFKVALSQTLFVNVATLPEGARSGSVIPTLPELEPGEYPEGQYIVADADSNGWPQTGRDRALAELRRAGALHIAGDTHLGTFVRYGIDAHDDAGHGFCVPSIANTWPRRWFPPPVTDGSRGAQDPAYVGRFHDGFGNPMTVLAVSNPHRSPHEPSALHSRAPGYGIVRLSRDERSVTVECWPRFADPRDPQAQQYPGWPFTLGPDDHDGRDPVGYLPELRVEGVDEPFLRVFDASGELVYALRARGPVFRPWVFRDETHRVEFGDPDSDRRGSYEAGIDRELRESVTRSLR